MAAQPGAVSPLFDAYVVLDFEATCERDRRLPQQEIIEFPMIVVDARTAVPVAEFQRYVRPVVAPVLSAFCTELTGITQSAVKAAATFSTVAREALAFLAGAGFGSAPPSRSLCFVTCGDWDLKTMLPLQMKLSADAPPLPPYFSRWVNLKKFMDDMQPPLAAGPSRQKRKIGGVSDMLRLLGLQFQGRPHSGIDDCRNIAAVLVELLRRGYTVPPTTHGNLPLWLGTDDRGTALGPLVPGSIASSLAPSPPVAPAPSSTMVAPPPEHGSKRMVVAVLDGVSPLDDFHTVLKDICLSVPEATRISKAMSRVLRHAADEMRLPMSTTGLVRMDDLLRSPPLRGSHATVEKVLCIVSTCRKQRFRVCYADDGQKTLYIGATQGHSLNGVFPDLRRITSPSEAPVAVHGTYWDAWQAIRACGYLSTMSRTHIHFARGLGNDSGVISGMRGSATVFVYLDVPKVLADGVELYESANGVLLTPGVGTTLKLPLAYVLKAVDRATGESIYPESK